MWRWLFAALGFMLVGCATTRNMTVMTRPPDAQIRIDGVDRGVGAVSAPIVFKDKNDTHVVTVDRLGYQEQSISLKRDYAGDTVNVDLKPLTKRVTITITPVPATVSIDGQPIPGEVDSVTREMEFTVGADNKWTQHTVAVSRKGFEPAEKVIHWQDKDANYQINLSPQKKDLAITTTPSGATLFLDGEPLGASPASVSQRPFPIDLQTNEAVPQKLRVEKKGYDPIEMNIGWDGGRTDYHVDLKAKTKTIHIVTDPAGAKVTIDGKPLAHDATGAAVASLQFPPVNANGDLTVYKAEITKKTADSEWTPQQLTIAWDGGKTDYAVTLKEIKTRPVTLLSATMQRGDEGWEVVPQITTTLAMKDVTEGGQKEPPQRITKLPHGTQIDTLAVSPDGTHLLFTILTGKDQSSLRSQMVIVNTDGSGGATYLSDGKSLEITPSYSPGGDQVLFSSNRAGKRLSIWSMSSVGAPGITQLTRGDTNDLWPMLNSDPKPRLFYQAMVDTRSDPRLYMTQLGTTTLTDLTQMGGFQPRVSPGADSVLFTAINDKTNKRDIYIMPDNGGVPRNLTNTPDVDEYDPAWNKNGTKIAFVSDGAVDEERRQNFDIWVMDLARPERPQQITVNGSWDDHPCWDPSGSAIYFRSNRGGDWAIWKIKVR